MKLLTKIISPIILLLFIYYFFTTTVKKDDPTKFLQEILARANIHPSHIAYDNSNYIFYQNTKKVTIAKNQDIYNQIATLQLFFSQGTISTSSADIYLNTEKPYAIISY